LIKLSLLLKKNSLTAGVKKEQKIRNYLPLLYPSVFYYPFEPLVALRPLKKGTSRGKKKRKRGIAHGKGVIIYC